MREQGLIPPGNLSPPPSWIANAADAEDALNATAVTVGCHKVNGAAKRLKNSADQPISSVADACSVIIVVVIVDVAIFVFVPVTSFVPVVIFVIVFIAVANVLAYNYSWSCPPCSNSKAELLPPLPLPSPSMLWLLLLSPLQSPLPLPIPSPSWLVVALHLNMPSPPDCRRLHLSSLCCLLLSTLTDCCVATSTSSYATPSRPSGPPPLFICQRLLLPPTLWYTANLSRIHVVRPQTKPRRFASLQVDWEDGDDVCGIRFHI